ncbi:hypothetical protein N0V88_007370 [Collariella sp. IMI 366227]|nr:hypothetical protein N0V88_007370 [Collariella sp. IMI 366227]
MAQYPPAQEWPDWCRVSCHGPHLVKVAFLDSLPRFMRKHGSSILDQVDNIRLRRLSHYKCCTDWNHEFVRADLVDDGSNKPLVMAEKQRGLRVKSGLPCQSIDRVTYITEDDFLDFVKLKGAYPLRTADFPTPGLNILQLASVLETHSLSFPTYHVYSTMCYWYADSTFEVLAEIGKANVCVEGRSVQKKGVWSWLNVDCVAYSGVTRRSLEDDTYQQQLVEMQGELVVKYDGTQKKAWSQEELARLPVEERQAIEQNGWNVAQFLRMIQDMPTHQKLFDDSTARAREVRKLLEKNEFWQSKRTSGGAQCPKLESVWSGPSKSGSRSGPGLIWQKGGLSKRGERADNLAMEIAKLKQRFGD